jgi:hypothetical protein
MKFREKTILKKFLLAGFITLLLFVFLAYYLSEKGLLNEDIPKQYAEYTKADYINYPDVNDLPPTKKGYPIFQPLLDVVKNWNPDNAEHPASFQETLQHFNYR